MELIEQEAGWAAEPFASFRENPAGWCGIHVCVLRLAQAAISTLASVVSKLAEIRGVMPLTEMYFLLCAKAPSIYVLFRCILG